jgi:hypothetical protein
MLLAPGGEEGGQGHVEHGHYDDGQDGAAQATECSVPHGQREEKGGAEQGPAEHDRGRRHLLDRDADEQERAAPDDRGGGEEQQCLPTHVPRSSLIRLPRRKRAHSTTAGSVP